MPKAGRGPAAASLGPIIWLIFMAAALAIIGQIAASARHSNWLWGLNHYFFLPPAWRCVAAAAALALTVPWVWARLQSKGRPSQGRCRLPGSTAVDIALACLFGLLFWALRMPNHLLGDGRLLIRLLDQGQWFDYAAPLDRLVHYGVLRLADPLGGWNAEKVYAALSVAAGAGYVFAALRLGSRLGAKWFVAGFMVTLGSVQLFLGYAESYSLATVAMLAYLMLALGYLEGKRSIAWVSVALVLGIGFHLALVFLVPSFVYLLLARRDGEPGAPRVPRLANRVLAGGGLLAGALTLMIAASEQEGAGGLATLVVPLRPDPIAQYTFFSWRHLADFLNEQVLLSPLAWLAASALTLTLALAGLRARRKASSVSGQTSSGLTYLGFAHSTRFRFLLVASVSGLAVAAILRPGLGGSRDWDLWSLGSMPYIVAVAAWVAEGMPRRAEYRYAAHVLVVVGFFHILPWVAVNRSASWSLDHFKSMLEANPFWTERRVAAAHNELASYYTEHGKLADALRAAERAVALEPDKAKYQINLALVYVLSGRPAEAERAFLKTIALDPNNPSAYNDLGRLCLEQGRIDEAKRLLERAIALDPARASARFNLGQVYAAKGNLGAAIAAFREACRIQPSNVTYHYSLAGALEQDPAGWAEAAAAWREVASLAGHEPSGTNLAAQATERARALEEMRRP